MFYVVLIIVNFYYYVISIIFYNKVEFFGWVVNMLVLVLIGIFWEEFRLFDVLSKVDRIFYFCVNY